MLLRIVGYSLVYLSHKIQPLSLSSFSRTGPTFFPIPCSRKTLQSKIPVSFSRKQILTSLQSTNSSQNSMWLIYQEKHFSFDALLSANLKIIAKNVEIFFQRFLNIGYESRETAEKNEMMPIPRTYSEAKTKNFNFLYNIFVHELRYLLRTIRFSCTYSHSAMHGSGFLAWFTKEKREFSNSLSVLSARIRNPGNWYLRFLRWGTEKERERERERNRPMVGLRGKVDKDGC